MTQLPCRMSRLRIIGFRLFAGLVGAILLASTPAFAWVHNSNSPETYCSPTPCGSVDSRIRSNPPGHKGLGYSDSELLLCTPSPVSETLHGSSTGQPRSEPAGVSSDYS